MDFFEDLNHALERFYLGFWEDQIAHILWVADAGKRSTISDWTLRAGEVELRNAYTLAPFRSRGVFESTLAFALQDLYATGIKDVYAHVKEGNVASENRFLAAGFRRIQHLRIRRVLGFDSIKRRPVAALDSVR